MAADKADARDGGSAAGFVVALVALMVAGAAAGFGFVEYRGVVKSDAGAAKAAAEMKPLSDCGHDRSDHSGKLTGSISATLLPLDPIIVSLDKTRGRAVRLEAHVLYAKAPADDQSSSLKIMAEDIMAFLRTVTLEQIESASGLEFLREDLSELVQLRTNGAARGIVIKGLMIE